MSKRLTASQGSINVDNVHIRVDGCLGPVTLRAYVTVAISTPLNDDTVPSKSESMRAVS